MSQETFQDTELDITGIGGFKVLQPVKGFRFNTDSLLLTVSLPEDASRFLEIGSGTGVCSLVAAENHHTAEFTAVEIQEKYYRLSIKNAELNHIKNIKFIHGDIKEHHRYEKGAYDVVFSNPPYRKHGHGRLSPYMDRNIAIYDKYLTAEELFAAVEYLMAEAGRFCVITNEENICVYRDAAFKCRLYSKKVVIFKKTGPHKPVYMEFIREYAIPEEVSVSEKEWKASVDHLFKSKNRNK